MERSYPRGNRPPAQAAGVMRFSREKYKKEKIFQQTNKSVLTKQTKAFILALQPTEEE
jgi:hypothetical protein